MLIASVIGIIGLSVAFSLPSLSVEVGIVGNTTGLPIPDIPVTLAVQEYGTGVILETIGTVYTDVDGCSLFSNLLEGHHVDRRYVVQLDWVEFDIPIQADGSRDLWYYEFEYPECVPTPELIGNRDFEATLG